LVILKQYKKLIDFRFFRKQYKRRNGKHMDGSVEIFDLLHYDKDFIHIIFGVFVQ
jgi:hypothetical protein